MREPASHANFGNHNQLVAPAQASADQSIISHSPVGSITPQTYATITADNNPPPQTTTCGDGNSADANVDPDSNAPKGEANANGEAKESANPEHEDEFVDAPEYMEATPGSNKRSRADDDSSSDDGGAPQEKKGKPISTTVPLSPNRFAALVDEAAEVPLPPDKDNTSVTDQIDLRPSDSTPRTVGENTPARDSSSDDESLTSDLHTDKPEDPDLHDDYTSSALDNESLDSPITQNTPNPPRTEAASPPSSSPALDCFTLGIVSKRTRPAPVVGSSRRSSF